ncbi:MAG: hypothetical protein ACM3NQ_24155 [Bacteroidales bacterium]
MNRSTTLLLIAVALVGYGVYVAGYVFALLVAVFAIIATLVIAAYVNRQGSTVKD